MLIKVPYLKNYTKKLQKLMSCENKVEQFYKKLHIFL